MSRQGDLLLQAYEMLISIQWVYETNSGDVTRRVRICPFCMASLGKHEKGCELHQLIKAIGASDV